MKMKLGQRNLMLLLNSELQVEPIIHGIHRLAKAHPDKQFTLVTGSDVSQLAPPLAGVDVICAPRENYQLLDQQSPSAGNVVEMNSLIDEIEDLAVDEIFQISSLAWGKWLTVSLQPARTQVVKISPRATALESYRRFCQAFSISDDAQDEPAERVYVDYASLTYEVQGLFAYDNLAQYCPWLNLVEQGEMTALGVPPKSAIVTSDHANFSRWSLHGNKAIFVDASNCNFEANLFLQNQFCLRLQADRIDAAQLFNSLSLWQRQRLNEYGLIQFTNDIEFFQIVKLGSVATCQSTRDLNQEYGIIQDVTRVFQTVGNEDEAPSVKEIETYFGRRSIDRFVFLNALCSIRYIVTHIIEAIDKGDRIFAGFANDYYKVSLGHEIIEILYAGHHDYGGTDCLKKRLLKYVNFLGHAEDFVNSRFASYRKQGDSR